MEDTLQIGDIVTGIYKTGKYIGEITDIRQDQYLLKVLAVLKHPIQGDLHHVKQVNVPFFHERRALSYQEQAFVPKQMVKRYEHTVPTYKESLQQAISEQIETLQKEHTEWAERCLENLYNLKNDYKL